MSDLTHAFDGLLKKHEAPPLRRTRFSLDEVDDFLKEAYRINAHITSLHAELRDVRQAYLSTAQPPRKTHLRSHKQDQNRDRQRYLTDQQREEIDYNAKKLLRELNASISSLSEVEDLRHETALAVIRKQHSRGLGVLGSWASGGGSRGGGLGLGKSREQVAEEEGVAQLKTHRESVLWFLRQKLQQCVRTQQIMMETRLLREVEKNRSVLGRAPLPGLHPGAGAAHQTDAVASHPGLGHGPSANAGGRTSHAPQAHDEETQRRQVADDLTAEQLQMFEKGSNDMMQYYESRLDKVMAAEKSLLEISELQTVLVNNLTTQSAHIEQLVADSFATEENVGRGNKQLHSATKKPSLARYTFFAATGLCAFLIVWDLVI